MRNSYDPAVYVAMRDGGLTNRRIGELLDVNEASVRRGLKKARYEAQAPTFRTVLAQFAELLDDRG